MTNADPHARRTGRRAAPPTRSERFTTDDESGHGIDVHILRGSPTPDEIAAVTAVLTTAVVEEAANADAVPTNGPSAWQRSQRVMRSPLTAGAGRWRNFTA
ncbi:hypothetical protein IWX78_002509 [Mycetocola sp. CAN_C7]|uniref:acyl-CoA carboxylase subunit epsilon n=1 Tax=Mycetocola sp. CAN_C7 TaxID=2787724 RepID=UPI001A2B9CEC